MHNISYSKRIDALVVMSLIATLVLKVYAEWRIPDFLVDKKTQIATALNLINSNGISIAYVEAADLSKIIYEPVGLWPPGFALSLAPLIKIGLSPIRASLVLETIAIFILFYSFYLILKTLKYKYSSWVSVIFFLFYSVSLQPFNFLFTSGLLSLGFCVLAIYFLIRNMHRRKDVYSWFCLGLSSFLPSFFHFSYYPISIILPCIFLSYSLFIETNKKGSAIMNLLVCIILLAGQITYQASLPTGINYLSEYHPITSDAPYWENMTMFVNLPIYLLTDEFIFKKAIGETNNGLYLIVSIVGWSLFLVSLFLVKKNIYFKYKEEGLDLLKKPDQQFVIISLILSWTLILFLIFLSLRYPAAYASWKQNNLWTYVAEARYFALVVMVLPLAITIGLWKDLQNIALKVLYSIAIISSLIFSTVINVYYIYKYGRGTPEENLANYYHHSLELENYFKEKKKNTNNYLLIYAQTSESDKYLYYPKITGIPILKYGELKKELRISQPTKILFIPTSNMVPEVENIMESLKKHCDLKIVKEFPDLNNKIHELSIDEGNICNSTLLQ